MQKVARKTGAALVLAGVWQEEGYGEEDPVADCVIRDASSQLETTDYDGRRYDNKTDWQTA